MQKNYNQVNYEISIRGLTKKTTIIIQQLTNDERVMAIGRARIARVASATGEQHPCFLAGHHMGEQVI